MELQASVELVALALRNGKGIRRRNDAFPDDIKGAKALCNRLGKDLFDRRPRHSEECAPPSPPRQPAARSRELASGLPLRLAHSESMHVF